MVYMKVNVLRPESPEQFSLQVCFLDEAMT